MSVYLCIVLTYTGRLIYNAKVSQGWHSIRIEAVIFRTSIGFMCENSLMVTQKL